MAVVWFLLGIAALVGAVVLLRIDSRRRAWRRKIRSIWGARRGLEFMRKVPRIAAQWQHGMIGRHSLVDGGNVVRGVPRLAVEGVGEQVLFDLEDSATIFAVRAQHVSAIVFEAARTDPEGRPASAALTSACPGTSAAATVGEWTIFSDDVEAARRTADMRLVAFLDIVPDFVDVIWAEGEWVLASFPQDTSWAEWDDVEGILHQFARLMRVLPPAHRERAYS
ncbi:hypothetical protein [Lolliginicoccus levis]|uniref:hypothetical protein n=1 Tax=Lolliginicoccus levis TaxID=2919542 RepID=UPI002420016C|nr:hypothetical protein [Lolliginicoccus levis]